MASRRLFDGAHIELDLLPVVGAVSPPAVNSKLWIRVAGVWTQAVVWIRVAGVWKQATPFTRVAGAWK